MTSPASRSNDTLLLRMLDARDGDKLNIPAIAERFSKSRSAVKSAFKRVDRDHREMPCLCVRPENKDGGMARGWWK